MLDTMVTMVQPAVIAEAVRLACRAPSLHNSQPWLWVLDGDRLELYVDETRAVHTDQSGREALISCGAVLDHLRVAMAAAGWHAVVDRFPNPNQPQHLASIGFTALDYVTDGQHRRADAILARRSDRLPLLAPAGWDAFETVLRARIAESAVRLQTLPEAVRPQLAEAAQLTESLRLYDSAYHAELDWWTAPFEVSDGIPQSALVSAAESDRVEVGRAFPVIQRPERRTEIGVDWSTIVMLSTDEDSRAAALACGEVLSTVLLECTLAGLATCPLTHLTELPASREILAALTGHGDLPQILIRVGVAPTLDETPPATPRRPLEDVLRITR
ncbi:NAD(P)H nitroreductase [Mycobacterium sp. pUA109]|uniref:Acg family FMN-binding oxidoreductase n=1 Tax=Mycobacterium sp. pUA109 TaxID=3238982 RepID=UPI00351BC6FC